jgi:hypothetical protein
MGDTGPARRPPERLLDLGAGLAIWRVHVDDLNEQPLNAQSMTKGMFARLQATVQRDGRLESLPFCCLTSTDPVRIEIISGHHRTRAARAAELFYVACLVDETILSRDQIAAKQLSANAIAGDSEAQLVARIFESIGDVDARLEAFIEPTQALPAPVRLPRLDIDLGYRAITLVMLPHQADAFDNAVKQVMDDDAIPDDARTLNLVDLELFDLWQSAMRRFGKEYDARAITVQVARLIEAAAAHLGIEEVTAAALDPGEWVPLASLFGSALIPPEAAELIKEAVTQAVGVKVVDAKARWQLLERWAADYLGR